MKWSETLISTLREVPQEAEIPSHRLMLRAGLMRQLSGGLYTFLPLGLRALRNVERIVREEMDRAGALEVLMPALQPRELWDRSGRYEVLGDLMLHVIDRQKREMVLGPTHEEVITDLVAREIKSYRQLPKTFYQIQNKFRDEIRPRFGLMRAKEFSMKDAYSFDLTLESADASYQAMYDAYTRIFDRCGLTAKVVEADTGAMGGKWSHEFMVPSENGEDGLAECEDCDYAANLERAQRAVENAPRLLGDEASRLQESEIVETPNAKTIEAVARFFHCGPERFVKTLIYLADGEPVAALVPGERELNDKKLLHALDAGALELAPEDVIRKVTGAEVGFAGPVGLDIPIVADISLRGVEGAITGANRTDAHLVNVNLARDTNVTQFHDLCLVADGDACPRCGGSLREKRGIEVGHVFKLGTKYSDALGATYLDDKGESFPMVMGCYGIGVTRTLQAVVEQCHDENGIVWPLSVAPYQVAILPLSVEPAECAQKAATLAQELEARGISVLLDDRDDRPGVKFKDSDLLGLPIRVVVSERSLASGDIELKLRNETEKQMIPLAEAVDTIAQIVHSS